MAQPTTQLNATEQDTLVKQIGLALLRAAPRDWRKVTAEYRAVGRYHELTGEIVTEDGTAQEWLATHDIATLFGRLRGGMYRDGRGTWFNARYQLDHPSSYNLEYNRDEPVWSLAPPPQAYSDELRMFPRTEENVPEWLIRRMSGLGPEQPGPHFRIARIFDTIGPAGRPVINRPDLEIDEQDRLLEYLDHAPLVVTDRGYDIDRLAQTPEATVPVAFHSDGQWIWPAAVNFYLRQYSVSPEADLIEHVRSVGFQLPPVDEPTLQAAAAYLTRGNQQRPPGPPPGPPQQQQPMQPMPPGPPPGAPLLATPPPVAPPLPPQQQAPPPPTEIIESSLEVHETAPEQAPPPAEPQPYEPSFEAASQQEEPQEYAAEPEYAEDGYDEEFDGRFAEEEPYPGEADQEQFEAAHASNGSSPEPGRVPDLEETAEYVPEAPAPREEPVHAAAPAYDPGPPTVLTQPAEISVATPEPPVPSAPPAPEPVAHEEPIPAPAVASAEPQSSGRRALRREVPDNPVLAGLQTKLEELGVPEGGYGLGKPTGRGWSVEEVDEGWRVGWYDGDLSNPAVFGDAEDAAAFMLGKVMLNPEGHVPAEEPPPPAPEPEPEPEPVEEPPQRVLATLSPEVATGSYPVRKPDPIPAQEQTAFTPAAELLGDDLDDEPVAPPLVPPPLPPGPLAPPSPFAPPVLTGQIAPPPLAPPVPPRREPPMAAPTVAVPVPPPAPPAPPVPLSAPPRREAAGPGGGGQGQQQWPIGPMSGEPPLTLFRGKELRELPAGSELDRFGGPNGNLTYAAGTPFEERSLVPEWVNRPYHVYRVQRPLETLAGVAIPWFNQPGGGSAYLLPASIEELLAEGDLIELDPGEPPVD